MHPVIRSRYFEFKVAFLSFRISSSLVKAINSICRSHKTEELLTVARSLRSTAPVIFVEAATVINKLYAHDLRIRTNVSLLHNYLLKLDTLPSMGKDLFNEAKLSHDDSHSIEIQRQT